MAMRLPLGRGRGGGSPGPCSASQSATKRSRRPMATGSPFLPSTQLLSHCSSCGQTRPQTAGRALVCLTVRIAAAKSPSATQPMKPGMSMPTGQPSTQPGFLQARQRVGLFAGQLGRVAQGHLVEVAHALDRLLLGHRPSDVVDRPRASSPLVRSERRIRCGGGARSPPRCSSRAARGTRPSPPRGRRTRARPRRRTWSRRPRSDGRRRTCRCRRS